MSTITATEKRGRGRPPKYQDTFPAMAVHLCRLGATNEDLARAFRVSVAGIDRWLAEKPAFADAVHEGRELADARVASALYSRAVGYTHEEEKVFQYEGGVVRAMTLKHYPPDTAACSLWLRNRRPDLWREKTQQQIDVTANGPDPLHEAAMRIMQADLADSKAVYEDEMRRIREGNPTVIEADAPDRMESPLHRRLGIAEPTTEAGERSFAQQKAKLDAKYGATRSPLHEGLGIASPRDEESIRQFAQMMAQADYELDHGSRPPVLEAENVQPEAAPEPERPPQAVQEPAAAPPADDFRAMLGIPSDLGGELL